MCCQRQTLLSIQDHLGHLDVHGQRRGPRRHSTMLVRGRAPPEVHFSLFKCAWFHRPYMFCVQGRLTGFRWEVCLQAVADCTKRQKKHAAEVQADREKVRDVCDRTEKVEVIERVNESVGSLKGIWEDAHNRKFEWYLSVIPVVRFNGQKYDVNVMKAELLSILIEEDPSGEDESGAIRFVIKRNSSMA